MPALMVRPVVSAVMPNYNDARFIREAIDGVLRQSLRDLELIIVDDGSTDDSLSIISEYARNDSRVRVFRNERNQGVVSTINRGVAEAQGKYLYLVSSNDKALPGFFEKSVAVLEQFPRAGLCWSDPTHFFESGG